MPLGYIKDIVLVYDTKVCYAVSTAATIGITLTNGLPRRRIRAGEQGEGKSVVELYKQYCTSVTRELITKPVISKTIIKELILPSVPYIQKAGQVDTLRLRYVTKSLRHFTSFSSSLWPLPPEKSG